MLGVIFDFDGVIVNTHYITDLTINSYLKELGFTNLLSKEEIVQLRGRTSEAFWTYIKEKFGLPQPVSFYIHEVRLRYLPIIKNSEINPTGGIREFIHWLKRNKIKTAIATSGSLERVITILKKIELLDSFDCIISGEEINESKPSPNIFRQAVKKLGLDIANCIVIEDSESGILAANNLRIKSIGFRNKNDYKQNLNKANSIITNFYDIYFIPEFISLKFNSGIKGLILDIRGTIIDPYLDNPVKQTLTDTLVTGLKNNLKIAFITATSLLSIEKLILPNLLMSIGDNLNLLNSITFYVDSGTLAYELDGNLDFLPLKNYRFLNFDLDDIENIKQAIDLTNRKFSLQNNLEIKIKKGQINYYCGGDFYKRLEMSYFLRETINSLSSKRQIYVMVPTSKDTIDIALCKKDKPANDFSKRNNIKEDEILILGDSLQVSGGDYDMKLSLKSAVAINVGKIPLHNDVVDYDLKNEDGAIKILTELVQYDKES